MNDTHAPLLQARHLSFAYPGQPPVLTDISLSIHRQEVVVLLGSSGCGKSTLLRLLAGLVPARAGNIRFLGQPLHSPHPRSALVFQQPSLLPWLRVGQNVAYGLTFKHQPALSRNERIARVTEALEAAGLQSYINAWPTELSGGQSQRAALARALARQPELLFADEPFSALDPISRAGMQRLLVDLVHRWHTAVLLVTHDIDEALQVADRIVLMGGSPGQIHQEWVIETPHPRAERDSEMAERRLDILEQLHLVNSLPESSTTAGHQHEV
jgi:NitT/TauT family transport system ATP-binding protein